MREKAIERVETHVAGACVANGLGPLYLLALRRSMKRQLFPGLWECVGGQVLRGQTFEDAALDHLKDEAGIEGRVICPIATYYIPANHGINDLIPGIRLLVQVDRSSNVMIDAEQHDSWAWIKETEMDYVDWIPGLKDQLNKAISVYKALHYNGEI